MANIRLWKTQLHIILRFNFNSIRINGGSISDRRFRLKNIDKIRNYLIEEVNRNELQRKRHKKDCRVLSYIEHSLILISTIPGCVSISTFTSLVGIPVGIKSSAIGLKICVISTRIKRHKSINKRNMIK